MRVTPKINWNGYIYQIQIRSTQTNTQCKKLIQSHTPLNKVFLIQKIFT